MALLSWQARRLREAGFTSFELGMLRENLRQRPQVLDLDLPSWRETMADRRKWLSIMLKKHQPHQIELILRRFYISQRAATIWDFIRAIYPRTKKVSGYREAQAERARERLSNIGKKPRRR